MPLSFHFLINGECVQPARVVAVRSPWDGEIVGEAGDATLAEIDSAVAAAAAARPAMAALGAWQRSECLERLAAALHAAAGEFAGLICAEAGKPVRDARREVDRGVLTLRTAAAETLRLGGELLPLDVVPAAAGYFGITRRFPVGVVAGITPFNFPLNLVLHKLAPALAAGNTIVIKASPRAPLTAMRLGELLVASGFPPGAANILAGGAEAARALVADPRVAMLSFTGSAEVGWQLKSAAGKKKVTLELGGNAANIVHGDADLDLAAARLSAGAFGYAGQSCISVQRVLVQRPVYAGLRRRLLAAVAALRRGDPRDPSTDLGPMITVEAAQRAQASIREAVAAGATLLCGGEREGATLAPAILENVPPALPLWSEEAFAPVLLLAPYDTPGEALARANDSRFGLQAGVFTRDWNFAWAAFHGLVAGAVLINEVSTWRMDPMPYGGVKDSGFGREGIRSALAEMTEERLLVVNGKWGLD